MKTAQISLRNLHDAELLLSAKHLAQQERNVQAEMLRHLAEIERRKLYADLKYPSLFEYAVRELGYSEPTASRRIKAMRLMKELPEVEAKIQSGALSVSNISQAEVFFRQMRRTEPTRIVSREEKASVLEKLENKSLREGERVLMALSPAAALPQERMRQIDLEHTEVRFTIDAAMKAKLQEVRSLLGPRGGSLSLSELVSEMATLSARALAEKKFGKKRVRADGRATGSISSTTAHPTNGGRESTAPLTPRTFSAESAKARPKSEQLHAEASVTSGVGGEQTQMSLPSSKPGSANARYIPRAVKHAVWHAAGGKCSCCGSKNNLQFDHIEPIALGGTSTPDNLQLLCGSCNLRRGVKTFGTVAMRRSG